MFVLPTFNVMANVWNPPFAIPPVTAPSFSTLCNWTLGRLQLTGISNRDVDEYGGNETGWTVFNRIMRTPFGLDLRGNYSVNGASLVEVPAGSGCFYSISDVAVSGSGFANQHLVAWAEPVGFVSPLPTPLPG